MMRHKALSIILVLFITTSIAFAQSTSSEEEPHRYGGWYCPDNLNGFPAVDVKKWDDVPVVNDRMPTQEELHNGASLINVDMEKYPNAKPLDMTMPRLATYYSRHTRKDEIVIIIQAINISNDSIVGFRYLNGGNGSARLKEVRFLTEDEIDRLPGGKFVSFNVDIKASQQEIFNVMTQAKYIDDLKTTFDKDNSINEVIINSSVVNFIYNNSGSITSDYAGNLFGNQYIQVDAKGDNGNYVQKFLLLENEETGITELKIACGPYTDDFENQKMILENWAQKVKELSEAL